MAGLWAGHGEMCWLPTPRWLCLWLMECPGHWSPLGWVSSANLGQCRLHPQPLFQELLSSLQTQSQVHLVHAAWFGEAPASLKPQLGGKLTQMIP